MIKDNDVYITKRFKEASESLNTQSEAQRKTLSVLTPHTKEYQNLLKEEIKLLEEKKRILNKESNRLEELIASK